MFQKQMLPIALKVGAVTGILGALLAWLMRANGLGVLIIALGCFGGAFLLFAIRGLTGKLLGMGLMGSAFGLTLGGLRGLLGGALGGVAYPLAQHYIPGRWGNAAGLFLLIAIPGMAISGSWKGVLAAAIGALIFTLFFEGGLWLTRRITSRK